MFEEWQLPLHGHEMVYRRGGSGPPVVLIHGMVNSSRHWAGVADALMGGYDVIAPDLIGHGDSTAPRGDYSLGAHAARIRDLLSVLGIERATIAGHSLGGGVAMQFFWQFPERVERLALISSGGLGPEVSPLLRTAALPGAERIARTASHPRLVGVIEAAAGVLERRGRWQGAQLRAIARAIRPLGNPGAAEAFLQTLRSVIDIHGQRVSAVDQLYLLAGTPTLIAWGERDRTIPIEHGRAAHAAVPGSRLETLPRAAHFPHLEDPEAVAAILARFIAETEPAARGERDWPHLIAERAPLRRRGLRVA